MHRLGPGRLGRIDQRADRKVGEGRRRGAETDGDIGEADMRRVGVGVAEDRNRAQSLGPGGADDTAGDLAAIGDEDGGEARAHGTPFAQDGARLPAKAASALASLFGPQRGSETLRRRLDIGLGRLASSKARKAVSFRRWRRARSGRSPPGGRRARRRAPRRSRRRRRRGRGPQLRVRRAARRSTRGASPPARRGGVRDRARSAPEGCRGSSRSAQSALLSLRSPRRPRRRAPCRRRPPRRRRPRW